MKVGKTWHRICRELTRSLIGHRLKSGSNKTTQMFSALRTPRRILLSGTPIQNDLSEFHAMVCLSSCLQATSTYISPGRFLQSRLAWRVRCFIDVSMLTAPPDDYSVFKRVYETPILKSRAPDCTRKEKEMGESRSAQVSSRFVLARCSSEIDDYFP